MGEGVRPFHTVLQIQEQAQHMMNVWKILAVELGGELLCLYRTELFSNTFKTIHQWLPLITYFEVSISFLH